MASAWDNLLKEWLIDTKTVCLAGLCSISSHSIYAACSDEGDPWKELIKEDHEVNVTQVDGVSEAPETVNELSTIISAVSEGSSPKGVWVGGKQYRIISVEKGFEQNNINVIFCTRNQGGCFLVDTGNDNVVICVYDETKNQVAGNCKKNALVFAEYLAAQGY
ncbi:uncharacterized protein CMU_043230 [Cryptosporidium muris RN66]|uniref:Profilin n=1 Tax=Cryptosporidium muris (strain RN66) TaxID=441375 RepID=B6AAK8_CRYMR|nr:uncharacterized protein CMU_043230 [Cryptosporidium muris RN66]EEA05249.1 hypothetical protein, conserved [Cryptosporidium muris RN66]|eukprot:XP_002139598.1 hypothetical protein [Cryptosporidium muris RN66]